ncbi:MAG: Calx-beta domain-containing protein [Pyrinomonadaceae bacterium]
MKRHTPPFPTSKRSSIITASKRRSFFILILMASVMTLAVGSGLLPGSLSAPLQDQTDTTNQQSISAEVMQQIQALEDEKESRTPAQKKIDSQLLYAAKMERAQPIASGVSSLQVNVGASEVGRVVVDISAAVDDKLLQLLANNGAVVLISTPDYNSVRVEVSLDRLEDIAGSDSVYFIQPKMDYMLSQVNGPVSQRVDDVHGSSDFEARAGRVRQQLTRALSEMEDDKPIDPGFLTSVGTRQSEGDVVHRANTARGAFNVDGTGIKIGVLSNGVASLGASQASGDLGPVTVLPGQGGSGDEGTAMLEIVHDLAPGAQLFFASANGSPATFAQNIRNLRTAGCDIIVDDVFYFVETPFQDGQALAIVSNTNGGAIEQAVIDVTAAGALYFSSAGNQGNKDANTASCFQGDFVDGGANALLPGGTVNNFGGGTLFDQVTQASGNPTNLYWADPLGGSSNDYDLFVLNSTGTAVVSSSTNVQSGTQDPFEQVAATAANNRIVVFKKTGAAARFFHITTNANGAGRLAITTEGTTKGHSTAANAYGVSAAPAVGPFPNAFSGTSLLETFTSDGPRRLFFNSDGTAITPGNFTSTGGLLRQKPDITAADGVSVTGVGGFSNPFFGTSAAAPHAAAIAGLIKQAKPAFTPAQIRTALTSSAIDISTAGVDRNSGAGIVMAYQSLQAAGAAGGANLQVGTIATTDVGGNGNGIIEPGEQGTLTIQLTNPEGVNAATAISSTLSSVTPGVSVTQPASAYPDIAANASANNTTPFAFAVSSAITCSVVNLNLTVNYSGGVSPKVFPVSLTIRRTINETLDNTTPPANGAPLFTSTTGLQTGRLVRSGVASGCGLLKGDPGLNDIIPNRRFDSYTFANNTAAPICVTVTLTSTNGLALYSAAYTPGFNPNAPELNFLGDLGSSFASSGTYSVTVPANSNFTIVVHEITAGFVTGTPVPYTLQVDGLAPPCVAAAVVNQAPVNTVPAAQSVVQNSQLVFSTGNGNAISIADADAGTNPVQETLTAANGTLTLGTTAGLNFSVGTGTNNSTMTFTGTVAAINTALQGLIYRPTTNFVGAASLTVNTNDQGFLGSGGAKSDNDVVTINVGAGSAFNFSSASYIVGESDGAVIVTVTRNGDLSTASSINYATSNGTATDRSDYGAAFGTLQFAAGQFSTTFPVLINEDSLVEGNESFNLTLSNPQGTNVALGLQSTAVGTIVDNATEPATNAIDDSGKFVEQHYHDFLNRESDPAGFDFWVNNIESCGANAACREVRRIDTSAAFFLSIEFQQTGYFTYRSYTAAFGPNRIGSTVPLTLQEFLPDAQQIGRGVIIGNAGADALLESNKQAYVLQFVQRPAFTTLYSPATTPANFVDALNTNTGNSLTAAERNALVAQLTANNTSQGRANVLRAVVDNAAFQAREFNRAFVLMEYFGYLRRNPNDTPDPDFSGYTFWLNKLNTFNGNFRDAEMVKAFITSLEYRKRFGLD